MGPCDQWSSAHPWLGTLVRHVLCTLDTMTMTMAMTMTVTVTVTGAARSVTPPPAPRSLGVRKATSP